MDKARRSASQVKSTFLSILLVCLAYLVVSPVSSFGLTISDEKMKAIQIIFENTLGFSGKDFGDRTKPYIERYLVERVREDKPSLSDNELRRMTEIVFEEVKSNDLKLAELWIPIYDRYFTLEELRGIASFFATETGRKYIRHQPDIEREKKNLDPSLNQQQLTEQLNAIAHKYYTPEEIGGITAFFATYAGKKYLEIQPLLGQEMRKVAEPWIENTRKVLYNNIKERLKEEGFWISP